MFEYASAPLRNPFHLNSLQMKDLEMVIQELYPADSCAFIQEDLEAITNCLTDDA